MLADMQTLALLCMYITMQFAGCACSCAAVAKVNRNAQQSSCSEAAAAAHSHMAQRTAARKTTAVTSTETNTLCTIVTSRTRHYRSLHLSHIAIYYILHIASDAASLDAAECAMYTVLFGSSVLLTVHTVGMVFCGLSRQLLVHYTTVHHPRISVGNVIEISVTPVISNSY
jgi:hypothetical protein